MKSIVAKLEELPCAHKDRCEHCDLEPFVGSHLVNLDDWERKEVAKQ